MTITLLQVREDGQVFHSGQHLDLLIFKTKEQKVVSHETNGLCLGLHSMEEEAALGSLVLEPGDMLLLYTDGVLEARDSKQDFYEARLRLIFEEFGEQGPEVVRQKILQSLQGYDVQDDVTLMLVKRDL